MVDWFRKEGGGWELARAAACMDILSDKRCKGAHCSTHVRREMINTPQRLTLMIKKKKKSLFCISDTSRITFQSLSALTRLDSNKGLPRTLTEILCSVSIIMTRL